LSLYPEENAKVDGEPESIDAQTLAETPEDVAILYSWANLQEGKYRDYSASQREYRAQMRHRAREMAEARTLADRQAACYEQSETRRIRLAGQQPDSRVPGEISDLCTDDNPQQLPGKIYHQPSVREDDMLPQRHPQMRDVRLNVPQPDPGLPSEPIAREYRATGLMAEDAAIASADSYAMEHEADPLRRPGSQVGDMLEHSRERQASKWYALKGVFDPAQEAAPKPARSQEMRVPMVTVFSMAGGTGKTSLVATLGRALSASGERVLLTDTTPHGLLHYYFGARELRPGVVRTFSPPPGSADAPIYLVSYDVPPQPSDPAAQEWVIDELAGNCNGLQRVVLDLAPGAVWLAKRLAQLNSVVIVPVAPDMNSVISLGTVEKFFNGVTDGQGRPVQPYFLLNQFDSSQRLHLDVREVMRRQLGDRLLPFVIRRSQAVSEALAEGMTVMDYAADAAVATDYTNLASWLRSLSMPAAAVLTNARWSER